MQCPECKGKGKTKGTISQAGQPDKVVAFTCFTCKGTGDATPEQAAQHHRILNAWCKCGNPSGNMVPYSGPGGSHGYNCADCGKLLQTG